MSLIGGLLMHNTDTPPPLPPGMEWLVPKSPAELQRTLGRLTHIMSLKHTKWVIEQDEEGRKSLETMQVMLFTLMWAIGTRPKHFADSNRLGVKMFSELVPDLENQSMELNEHFVNLVNLLDACEAQ